MKLQDVMTRDVEFVSPDSTLQEAACKMKDLDVGPMPVCQGDRVVGMLTDRDITIRATAEGLDPKTTKVSQVMTGDVVFCQADDDVQQALRLMQDRQIRRLLVCDRNDQLVGIVSLGDLAVEVQSDRDTSETLERISQPSEPQRKAA